MTIRKHLMPEHRPAHRGRRCARPMALAALWLACVAGVLPTPAYGLQACSALTERDFESHTAQAYRIQRTLSQIYGPQAERDGVALTADGEIGGRSVATIIRFCRDVGLDSAASAPHVLSVINSFATIIALYPAWREIVGDPAGAFAAWARALPVGQYPGPVENGRPLAPGAALLIDRWLREDVEGPFLLTPEGLETLAAASPLVSFGVSATAASELSIVGAPTPLIERVAKLAELGYVYASYDSVDARLDAAMTLGDTPSSVEPSNADPQVFAAALLVDAERHLEESVSASGLPPLPMAGAPLYRQLVQAGVRRDPRGGARLTETELDGLVRISGIMFPDVHTFATAVRLHTGIGAGRPEVLGRVLTIAREGAPSVDSTLSATLPLQPIAWDGGSCGCGVFEAAGAGASQHLYGVYPFWTSPRDSALAIPVPVEFSQLSRVAYYGLTFNQDGEIKDSLHWKQGSYPPSRTPTWTPNWVPTSVWILGGRDFSDFSKRAHQYKSKVDLVVYNSNWSMWLPRDTSQSEMDRSALRLSNAFDAVQNQAVERITTRLPGFLERLKPFMSLGQSPRRTLGDGITLDFDFDGVSIGDQSLLFDNLTTAGFFEKLRANLDASQGEDDGFLLDLDLDYALNVVVPAHCIAAFSPEPQGPCGFYSMKNLLSIAEFVDLFLIDLSAQSARDSRQLWSLPPIDRVRSVRGGMEVLRDSQLPGALALTQKFVPLIAPGAGAEVGALFRETKPFLAGAGSWFVPTDPVFGDSLDAVFFPQPEPVVLPGLLQWFNDLVGLPVRSLEIRLCNLACPFRWPVRLAIFVGAVFVIGAWVRSEVHFEIKKRFESRRFFAFGTLMAALLWTTVWCDPFWRERKGGVLMAFALVALGLLVRSRTRARRERDYP